MSKHLFINTSMLSRFILRRDRIRIPIWILSLSVLSFVIAMAFTEMYPTAQEMQIAAETLNNPAVIAMLGPIYGLDNVTVGGLFAAEMLLFTAIAVGIMSILFVARHTRTDEEEGRIEMIRSLPVGRLSNLNSTMLVSVITNVILALFVGFGLYALQIESMDLEGSLIYGAALGATGIIFAAITAIFAQLTVTSRGTIGFSITILLLSYLIRAIGDVGNGSLSWFSPFGWVLKSEAYVNNEWWPIFLTIGMALIFTIISLYLNTLRDLDAGFIPAKPGKRNASIFLQSPIGLAVRLQRTGLIAWAVGMYVLGASYGSVLGDLESYITNNEMIAKMLANNSGISITEQFISMLMKIITMACSIPALMAVLKLRGEEKRNHTEHLFGRAVSRSRLLGSYLVISVVTAFVMVSLAAIGLGGVGNTVMEEAIPLSTFYSAAIVYLPAILVMIGIAVLLIGFAPKLTSIIWGYLTYTFFVIYLGQGLQLPDWMSKLTPFGYIPAIPGEEMDYLKVSILTIIAAILIIAGFIGYRKRDIQ